MWDRRLNVELVLPGDLSLYCHLTRAMERRLAHEGRQSVVDALWQRLGSRPLLDHIVQHSYDAGENMLGILQPELGILQPELRVLRVTQS